MSDHPMDTSEAITHATESVVAPPAAAQPATASAADSSDAASSTDADAAAAAAGASASSAAAASAPAPSASPTSAQDDADEDALINEDIAEEDITGDAPAAKKKRGRPSAAAGVSSGPPADALERLNDLLRKTEQFAKFIGTDKAAEKKGRGRAGRTHERAAEEEEDKELVNDELQQADKKSWPSHLDEQPTSVNKPGGLPMRDYQLAALNWMIQLHDQGLNGILADEMGLGKTLESLSLLAYLKQYRGYAGPHLIIVPKSTSSNWLREVGRWTNNLSVHRFHGNAEEREAMKPLVATHDITITTYEMVILEKGFFAKQKWKYIYIDEAHRIKNENSLLSRVVRSFYSEHRLLITGTPLQNNLHELWALLNFLVPQLFHSSDDFGAWFEGTEDGSQRNEIVARLHRLLRPFLLRRLKIDVEKSLLPKIETKLFVGLSEMQKAWYKKILERDIEVLNATNTSKVRLLNIVMQLRKVCCHPYLFSGAEPGPPYLEGEHIVTNSSKMTLLDKLLSKLQAGGHRVLIFSQMTRVLDILEDYCRYRGYDYNRIDGQTKQDERDEAMDSFNAPDSTKFIFLLSTRAGGLGINLQTADTVILFDSDWNPQMDLQAMDRAHRIGQRNQVRVFRFVVEHTIEQKMVERATKKLFLDALVIKGGRLNEAEKAVNAQELQEMVRFGANRIFSGTDTDLTDADIDAILARGSELTRLETEKLKQSKGNDLLNFSVSNDEATNFQMFEGKDYTGFRASQGFEFIEPAARSRKSNYDINAYYRDALRVTDKKAPKHSKEFKPTQRFDYQFFDIPRLEQLERKDFESKQRLYNLRHAMRVKAKEERRARDEKEKEERRKLRYQNRRKRKQEEAAAAAAAGVALPAADEKDDQEEGDMSDSEDEGADKDAAAATAAPADASAPSAAAASAAEPAAAAASAPAADAPVKMEIEGEEGVKKEPEAAAAATAAAPDAAKSESAAAADATKSEADNVKMETDTPAAAGDAAAAAPATPAPDAAGRRKSGRGGRNSVAAPTPSPLPGAGAGGDDEEEGDNATDEADAELMIEAGCLTAEERAEMLRLQAEGFGTWSRRHITSLTRAMEKFGRDDISNIKVSVEEKTPEEVEKYYYVFWNRYKEIKDWDKIIKQVERGEQKLAKQKALQIIIDNKVRHFKGNYEKMSIPYPTTQQKSFTEEEDKFLIVSLHRVGYGNWEDLKSAIRSSWMFRFDWFFKSRTCGELSKRVEYLLKILEKEQIEWEEKKRLAEKKKKERMIKEAAKLAAAAAAPSPSKKKKEDKEGKSSSSSSKKKSSEDDSGSSKKKHSSSSSSSSHKDKEKDKKKDKDRGDGEGGKSSKSHKDKEKDKEHKSAKSHKHDKDKDKDKKKKHKDKESSSSASSSTKHKDKSDKKESSSSSSSASKKKDGGGKDKEKEKESKKRKDTDSIDDKSHKKHKGDKSEKKNKAADKE